MGEENWTPSTYLPDGETRKQINKDGNLKSIVLIGANGSGKSRLGAWIEANQIDQNIFRISAQRSLSIPDDIRLTSMETALLHLNYGANIPMNLIEHGRDYLISQRVFFKWEQKQTNFVLDNFSVVISSLFAMENEVNRLYREVSRTSSTKIEIKDSPIDRLKSIWNKLLPHRSLEFIGNNITVKTESSEEYPAFDLSDGERVMLYMLGHCLVVPDKSIIIIDEPEIHIHKAILNKFWSLLEAERPDCLFIYLTQDLDFAVSRQNSKKIWVKSYNGNHWEYEDIPQETDLPEKLLFKVMGSRKNIIFVEGNKGGNDDIIYQEAYPDYTVIPCGGCEEVIRLVKAFKTQENLHHLKVFGIIDRDCKTEDELNALKSEHIYSLEVAEIENLFCVKEIIDLICKKNGLEVEKVYNEVVNIVIDRFKAEMESQISKRSITEIQNRFNESFSEIKTKEALLDKKDNGFNSIDIENIYNTNEQIFNTIIETKDYAAILKFFNNKGLSNQISEVVGEPKKGLISTVIRFIQNKESKNDFISALRGYLPDIEEKI